MIKYYLSPVELMQDAEGILPAGFDNVSAILPPPFKIEAKSPKWVSAGTYRANYCIVKLDSLNQATHDAMLSLPNVIEFTEGSDALIGRLASEGADIAGITRDTPIAEVQRAVMRHLIGEDRGFD